MAVTADQMLGMSRRQLDQLFGSHAAGEIPEGEARGTVIIRMGRWLSVAVSKIAHRIAWQGKVFDPEKGELRNKILPFGIKAIAAKVYRDSSWLDEKETIVLDYSKTSLVAHWIRDEIREVGPGVYLGLVYWERHRILHFALKFAA